MTSVTALGVDTVQMSHATGKILFRYEVVEFMEKCFIARPDPSYPCGGRPVGAVAGGDRVCLPCESECSGDD